MEMKFEDRPYSGKTFRPRPEIHLDEPSQLLIVATPWGARSGARKAIDRMTDYLNLAREDREATSPFQRLTCLSTLANNLRIAALLANEALFREDNRVEYKTGVELFAAAIDENELVWIQAGNPQILLSRRGRTPAPIGSQVDLAFDLSESKELLAPLPSQLLGLDVSLNLNINSFRVQDGDQVILLSHSNLPESILTMPSKDATLDNLSRSLATSHPDAAFWLGILSMHAGRNSGTPE